MSEVWYSVCMNTIIGHKQITELLMALRIAGRLSHAYCFAGPEKVGKRTVAEALAADVLGIALQDLPRHPDFYRIRQEQNEKTGKTKMNIDVDQVRDLKSILSSRAVHGGYKIAIIDGAEKMSLAAANALLKTLEEPRGKTLLVLVTSELDALPATIRSRTQTLRFDRVPVGDMAQALADRGNVGGEYDEMVRLSAGLPGQLLDWMMDGEAFVGYKNDVLQFAGLPGKTFHEKRVAVEAWFQETDDSIAERGRIIARLAVWRLVVRDTVQALFGDSRRRIHHVDASPAWTRQSLVDTDAAIRRAMDLVDHNINTRLLVEQILLAIP